MASAIGNPVFTQEDINVEDLSPSSIKVPQLPGKTVEDNGGSAEPKVCSACNQKIVTNQPGGMTADEAMEKAAATANLCEKWCGCFSKALDNAEQIQGMAGE